MCAVLNETPEITYRLKITAVIDKKNIFSLKNITSSRRTLSSFTRSYQIESDVIELSLDEFIYASRTEVDEREVGVRCTTIRLLDMWVRRCIHEEEISAALREYLLIPSSVRNY